MKMKQETIARKPMASATAKTPLLGKSAASSISPLIDDVLQALPQGTPRAVARAPGRLDVFGGITEHCGATVLNTPIADHVCVGMASQNDGIISVLHVNGSKKNSHRPYTVKLSALLESTDAGGPDDPDSANERNGFDSAFRCTVGTIAESIREGLLPPPRQGLTLAVGSTLGQSICAGIPAAVAGATLAALSRMFNVEFEPSDAVRICQQVQNRWLGIPVGSADAACVLFGEAHTISQIRGIPYALQRTIPLPEDVVLCGIESGVSNEKAKEKYGMIRTAAHMGRLLIERIVQHEDGERSTWDRILPSISVAEYVRRFRDRIPTKMKGKEFLDRFGETGDPLTHIKPNQVYKIRSRTEHYIYESARALQFAETVSQAIQGDDRTRLFEAGELMYSSHWSYGQRCGLGTAETDSLVSQLRDEGAASDIYGARVSGMGCGGMVTVMMRATSRGFEAIDRILESYGKKTGHNAKILHGSSDGTFVDGAQASSGASSILR